jgi:hypothetical protein
MGCGHRSGPRRPTRPRYPAGGSRIDQRPPCPCFRRQASSQSFGTCFRADPVGSSPDDGSEAFHVEHSPSVPAVQDIPKGPDAHQNHATRARGRSRRAGCDIPLGGLRRIGGCPSSARRCGKASAGRDRRAGLTCERRRTGRQSMAGRSTASPPPAHLGRPCPRSTPAHGLVAAGGGSSSPTAGSWRERSAPTPERTWPRPVTR